MIPNDTLYASFVRNFGEETLRFLVQELYPSPVFKLVMFSAAVYMLVDVGRGIAKGKVQKYTKLYFFTSLLALPIGNEPVCYSLVKNFSSLMTFQLQKSTYNLFSHFGSKKTYPPGFVAETLMKAATSKITEPGISKAVSTVIENCVPFGEITDNQGNRRPINASDLFRVQVHGSIHEAASYVLPFSSSLLENRKIKIGAEETDCHSFLLTTLSHLYAHIHSKGITTEENRLHVGPMNGELNESWISKWSNSDYASSALGKTALNLAAASAVQAQVLNNYLGTDIKLHGKHYRDGNNSPLIELQKDLMGKHSSSTMTFNLMNLPASVLRSFNSDHYIDNATNLLELNERLINTPYYISIILIYLMILLPFILMTPYVLSSFSILKIWCVSYFFTLLLPWIMMISRSILNIILLHSLNINENATLLSSDPSYLKLGIDFSAVENMTADSGRLISTYLATEVGIWGSILMIIPVVGWFASGAGGRGKSFMAGRLSSMGTRAAESKGVEYFNTAKEGVAMKLMPGSAGAMVARQNIVTKASELKNLHNKDASNRAFMNDPANKQYLKNIRHVK